MDLLSKKYAQAKEIEKLKQDIEAYKQSEQKSRKIIAELKAYKDVNEDFKTAWEELKAENEKLREDYIKLSQQKDLDNARWQKRCTDLHIEDKAKADKYWLVLQEIKAIVCGNYEIIDPQGRKDILKLITKAEEE